MKDKNGFYESLYGVGNRARGFLEQLPVSVQQRAEEIRLRVGLPIALTICGETVFVGKSGTTQYFFDENLPIISKAELEESFLNLCGGSVYAHEAEIKNGFISMKNGCRAGIFGTLTENGFMKDITSINIRIAHEIKGAANDIVRNYSGGGLLIAGPPGSGKTTILRDFVRQLSNGKFGKIWRVAVIDSRSEISGSYHGESVNDLGSAFDLLITSDKAKGIEIALRTMYPEIIAFDEIGTLKELQGVKDSFYSGVAVVTTAHIGCMEELLTRNVTAELINSGAIEKIALLPKIHGGEIKVISARELLNSKNICLVG